LDLEENPTMLEATSPAVPFVATMGRGWAQLPADGDASAFGDRLRRALHTIECRELGPQAARQRFGPFVDLTEGHLYVSVDPDRLLALYPKHGELHDLVQAIRERGPAVNVSL
jgi:hypothetical protein